MQSKVELAKATAGERAGSSDPPSRLKPKTPAIRRKTRRRNIGVAKARVRSSKVPDFIGVHALLTRVNRKHLLMPGRDEEHTKR